MTDPYLRPEIEPLFTPSHGSNIIHNSTQMGLAPVHFFSHGSPMMLCETSASSEYWRKCGDEALVHKVKGIVIMSAHWATHGDQISVSTNPTPKINPIGFLRSHEYLSYTLTPDPTSASRITALLTASGFNVTPNASYNWIADVYVILMKMFPGGSPPPTTVISMNARYDPYYHLKVGSTLRELRREGYLLIGTGGAVHNLYRNRWMSMIRYGDSFAQEVPPEDWALEFRQAVEDVLTKTRGGPGLRRAVVRLMKHPRFRDAHATDEHFMAAVFVAGAVGNVEDEGAGVGVMGAETWELSNMANSQFTLGRWEGA
ncbi:catalytic LigB subunit of aromatic ring-opening dioxygenase [Aspergillus ellipticus CBS 707.79]|uniref:Catalytic LigB subunit of aromatic ring-opening dioxygenase n=1 Tax=Aspergillus ellipticus CBS 707.79 TaxID=1448320 RepID=A0A319DGH1_9EURO|nr:catalytic LigB subunit of aromatic ring-opening dioxygenase [Aspergillus ellipticus CBS 707.79]